MERKRKNPVKIAVIAVVGVVALAFIGYSAVWLTNHVHMKSLQKTASKNQTLQQDESDSRRFENGQYSFFIATTPYMYKGSGNLSIRRIEDNGDTDLDSASLLVWPRLFGETEYGLVLQKDLPEDEWYEVAGRTVKTIGRQMYVDKDGNPTGKNSDTPEEDLQLCEQNRAAIDAVFSEMHKVWPNL